jgi:HSP20 family protein
MPLSTARTARVSRLASDQPFANMARQMGKIVDQLNRGYYSFYPSETWTPNVNLYETEVAYLVCVDLAGVEKEKIDISVHGQQLTIRGLRATPSPHDLDPGSSNTNPNHGRTRVHLMEIDHGAFVRVVELPRDVASQSITAEHRNGILWITLPKR